jgi:hypothetical protein
MFCGTVILEEVRGACKESQRMALEAGGTRCQYSQDWREWTPYAHNTVRLVLLYACILGSNFDLLSVLLRSSNLQNCY